MSIIVIIEKSNKIGMSVFRSYSLRVDQEYRQLQLAKQKLNQQMTITNYPQKYISPRSPEQCSFPDVLPDRSRTRSDRYVSQTIRYQNNLRATIADIKKKMDLGHSTDLSLLSTLSPGRGRERRTIRHPIWDDFKVKPASLQPLRRTDYEKSYYMRNRKEQSPKKKQMKKLRKTPVQRFNFQPWQTIEEVQMHSLHQ